MTEYKEWLAHPLEQDVKDELLAIANDEKAIEDRFYRALAFGTGGLRGVIGAGTNRMNRYTVGRATLGLADYLMETYQGKPISVAIAYDSRNKSDYFARVAAEVLSSKGITAYLFPELTPTPVLSFAVRYLKAQAGIVITASHNPKEYNGYKVYNEHGCQITDGAAAKITENINAYGYFTAYEANENNIKLLDDEVKTQFLHEIKKFSLTKISTENTPSVVYTPLHGTGMKYVKAILNDLGVSDLHIVKEQELPDPTFTTCPYPNPEEKAALDLALRDAKAKNADLVMATDPDADRIGIAVKDDDGEYRLLNGNETGCILLYYILTKKQANGTLGAEPTVIKTIVTTDLVFAMADEYAATVKEVLTGFKYIGEALDQTRNYVFGLEESYGYLVGAHARDKDAVSAVMMIAEASAYYKSQGKSLWNVLCEIYARYGYYGTDLFSISMPGKDGMENMQAIIRSIRSNPSMSFDGEAMAFTDFADGVDGLPKSDVLRFKSENYRVLVRPSGTEPKLKIYLQARAKNETDAKAKLTELKAYVQSFLK